MVLWEFGKIDILVNNGGRFQYSLCVEASLDVFKELININYFGMVFLTKCVLLHMIERKQGKIVTMNSLAGILAAPLSSGYSASKHALWGFFISLRTELCTYPGIVVSNIYAGPVQTNVWKNALHNDVTQAIGSLGDQFVNMATSRCVPLILVSMANDLKEVWIVEQPFLLLAYFWQYMPTWAWWLTNKLGKKMIEDFKNCQDADSSHFKTLKTKHDWWSAWISKTMEK